LIRTQRDRLEVKLTSTPRRTNSIVFCAHTQVEAGLNTEVVDQNKLNKTRWLVRVPWQKILNIMFYRKLNLKF